MTIINPSLAAAIAELGVPLSADWAPLPAKPRWHQLRTELIRTFRDYMPETAGTKAVDLVDEVITEALLEGTAEIRRLKDELEQRVCELIVTELPRRTGMRIDPNEHWDAQATKKALAGLDDAGIIARRDWLLTSCAEMPKQHEAALYEYGLHLSRELTRRKITLTSGGAS
jgi:hypothetical protein